VKLAVVTSNAHKAEEIAEYFSGTLDVDHVPLECPEFRDSDVRRIARAKAGYAWKELSRPLIVDDTAFCIRALNGFPGPYAAYVFDTIGNRGILRLMEGVSDRAVSFETAIACAWPGGIEVFSGTLEGTLTTAPRGNGGFGYDPVVACGDLTLAEIPLALKSRISHRARALAALGEWIRAGGLGVRPGDEGKR